MASLPGIPHQSHRQTGEVLMSFVRFEDEVVGLCGGMSGAEARLPDFLVFSAVLLKAQGDN
jgi:hypothetical protein